MHSPVLKECHQTAASCCQDHTSCVVRAVPPMARGGACCLQVKPAWSSLPQLWAPPARGHAGQAARHKDGCMPLMSHGRSAVTRSGPILFCSSVSPFMVQASEVVCTADIELDAPGRMQLGTLCSGPSRAPALSPTSSWHPAPAGSQPVRQRRSSPGCGAAHAQAMHHSRLCCLSRTWAWGGTCSLTAAEKIFTRAGPPTSPLRLEGVPIAAPLVHSIVPVILCSRALSLPA